MNKSHQKSKTVNKQEVHNKLIINSQGRVSKKSTCTSITLWEQGVPGSNPGTPT
jgi:hypothetical protein